jgi:hypothetical protein
MHFEPIECMSCGWVGDYDEITVEGACPICNGPLYFLGEDPTVEEYDAQIHDFAVPSNTASRPTAPCAPAGDDLGDGRRGGLCLAVRRT